MKNLPWSLFLLLPLKRPNWPFPKLLVGPNSVDRTIFLNQFLIFEVLDAWRILDIDHFLKASFNREQNWLEFFVLQLWFGFDFYHHLAKQDWHLSKNWFDSNSWDYQNQVESYLSFQLMGANPQLDLHCHHFKMLLTMSENYFKTNLRYLLGIFLELSHRPLERCLPKSSELKRGTTGQIPRNSLWAGSRLRLPFPR